MRMDCRLIVWLPLVLVLAVITGTDCSRGQPNIVFILTDDQDTELGSLNYMPKVQKTLMSTGATFTHAYSTTPVCCPSRSSILTGRYSHNHNVFTNGGNCSSPEWRTRFENDTFAAHLHNAGYRTALFGKYLNGYDGSHIPYGWSEWGGLVKNSKYYNYTINFNGKLVRHGNNYTEDYYPDVIANQSIEFVRNSSPKQPFLLVASFPSPHGPEDSAPQYQKMFTNATSHRTPSWNHAPNPDKQWMLRRTGQMDDQLIRFTDLLHQKRLQTLQSVDDAVQRVSSVCSVFTPKTPLSSHPNRSTVSFSAWNNMRTHLLFTHPIMDTIWVNLDS